MLDEYSLIELESKIRSKILKKYPWRKKNSETENTDKEENITEDDE